MKFSTNSKVLSKVLDSVATALPFKSVMAILNTILLEQDATGHLRITASDLDRTIIERLPVQFHTAATIPPVRIAAPAKHFLETIRALGDVPVTIEVEPHYVLKITAGTGEFTLSGHDGADYPSVPTLESRQPHFSVSREMLIKGVTKAAFAVAKTKKHSAMVGILFQTYPDGLRIVGTDSLRLVVYKALRVESAEPIKAVLPVDSLKGIARMSGDTTCRVTMEKKHAALDFGTSRLITRRIGRPYPNYERVLPMKSEHELRVERTRLLAAARRISLYAGSNAQQVRFEMTADKVRISAEDVERAHSAFEELPCEFGGTKGGSNDMSLAYSSDYLLGALGHIDSEHVVFGITNPNKATILRPQLNDAGEEVIIMLMPVLMSSYM